jgi:hypothetical protein
MLMNEETLTALPFDNHLLARMLSEQEACQDWESFSPEDWSLVVRHALVESVGPQLYWALSEAGMTSLLPKPELEHLRAVYFGTRMKNEQNLRELETLTGLFDQAGIPVVALKGVCFALTIYRDIGLRPMVDIDLLVPDTKISEAVRIAETLGYTDTDTEPEALSGLNQFLRGEVSLRKSGMPFTMLELHNSLLVDVSFTYAVPVDWFWEHTELMTESSSRVNLKNLHILAPHAQLLYAAAHSMLKHGARNTDLRWRYDLDRMIRFHARLLDWDVILHQAKVFQWSSALAAALSQTYDYFNTPIPEHVLSALSKTTDAHQNLVLRKGVEPSTRVLEEQQSLMERKWYGKFIVILGIILPGPAYMRWRYGLKNSWTLPLWYIYRWWGIFVDGARTVWHLLHTVIVEANPPAKGG